MSSVSPPARAPATSASATSTPSATAQSSGDSGADAFAALLDGLTATCAASCEPAMTGNAPGSGEVAADESAATAGMGLLPDPVPGVMLPMLSAAPALPPLALAAQLSAALAASTAGSGEGAAAGTAGAATLQQATTTGNQYPGMGLVAATAQPAPAAPTASDKAFGELANLLQGGNPRADASEASERARLPEPAPLTFAAGPSPVDTARAHSEGAAAVHRAAMASQPQDPTFAGDLTAEVRFLMNSGLQQAELHLNPADLGPIHIHLSVSAQTADISFSAAHSATREGIAQSLPALREMLASQGMSLGQAAVGQDGRQPPQPGQQARSGAAHPGDSAGTSAGAMLNSVATVRVPRGMLDLYA